MVCRTETLRLVTGMLWHATRRHSVLSLSGSLLDVARVRHGIHGGHTSHIVAGHMGLLRHAWRLLLSWGLWCKMGVGTLFGGIDLIGIIHAVLVPCGRLRCVQASLRISGQLGA
jgi:hypothetical protein